MLVNLLIVLIIIFLLLVLSMVWPPDSPWSPWWRTDKKLAKAICSLGKISSKDLVYDLGSGDGTFMIVAAKTFKANCIGVEIDPIRFLISKLRIRLNGLTGKVVVKRKNLHKENLSKASVIIIYLVPRTLELVRQKLIKEVSPETRIISVRYKMSLPLVRQDKKNKLFMHKVSKGA